ncbi:MAG: GTPase [Bdellovibrionales bacterium]
MSTTHSTGLPRIGVVGRPNVGKSTLFNILTRTRKAVVKNQPGVTRDVQIEQTEWWGKEFEVLDTGGLTNAEDRFSVMIKEHLPSVLNTVDAVVVVMDGKSGLVPEDRDVIKLVQRSGKPYIIVVNKVDQMHQADILLAKFYEFGVETITTSFERQSGVDQIGRMDIRSCYNRSEEAQQDEIRLAIVGKPNVRRKAHCAITYSMKIEYWYPKLQALQ